MARGPKPPAVNEAHVRRLLEKYACPVPYHEVRTRFLGNIATPNMTVSPISVVKDLWGGEFPPFDSMDDLNELLSVLVNGLWNSLTLHQKRTEPFRLAKVNVEPTPEGIGRLAFIRQQELDGFFEGLLSGEDEIDLPERAARSLDALAELRGIVAGTSDLIARTKDDPDQPDRAETERTLMHIQRLTPIIEKDLHAVVLDCTRARRAAMREGIQRPPTFH
jgi:hypothetical protein